MGSNKCDTGILMLCATIITCCFIFCVYSSNIIKHKYNYEYERKLIADKLAQIESVIIMSRGASSVSFVYDYKLEVLGFPDSIRYEQGDVRVLYVKDKNK